MQEIQPHPCVTFLSSLFLVFYKLGFSYYFFKMCTYVLRLMHEMVILSYIATIFFFAL